MATGVAFPTWAYNAAGSSQLVQTQAALTALGATWSTTPFSTTAPGAIAPADPGFTDTDIRLQQLLVEARVLNLMVKEAFGIVESPDNTGLRNDVLLQDVGLTS